MNMFGVQSSESADDSSNDLVIDGGIVPPIRVGRPGDPNTMRRAIAAILAARARTGHGLHHALLHQGIDPRAGDDEPGWSLWAHPRDGDPELVVEGWSGHAAKSLVQVVATGGARTLPIAPTWHVEPTRPEHRRAWSQTLDFVGNLRLLPNANGGAE